MPWRPSSPDGGRFQRKPSLRRRFQARLGRAGASFRLGVLLSQEYAFSNHHSGSVFFWCEYLPGLVVGCIAPSRT